MAKYRKYGASGPKSSFAQSRFDLQLDEFINKVVPEKQTAFFRKVVLEVGRKLLDKSPVDTGRFRGNWYVGINAPDRTVSEETDKTGAKSRARARKVIERLEAGDVAIISNNLPYALMLEYGWSNQAPQGMAAITVEEVKDKLSAEKRRDRNG